MASKPFFRRGCWLCSAKLVKGEPHKQVRLGRHDAPWSAGKPPKRPPVYVLEAHAAVEERERAAARPGGGPRETDFEAYVTEYAERYRRTRGRPGADTMRRVAASVIAFAKVKGVKTVQQAGKAFVRDWMEMRSAAISHGSVKAERGVLSPIWSRAVEDDLIPANPWRSCRVPGKPAEHVARVWTSAEVARLIAAAPLPWHANLFRVLANTGIRVSAALAMRWEWVDWGRSLVTIPPAFDKTGKGYQIAMTQGARNVLEPMHAGAAPSGPVFPSGRAGKCYSYGAAKGALERAVKASGVPAGTLHDFRHTFAHHLCETAPLNVVQAALGHGSIAMTSRYVKLQGAATAKFVDTFEIGGEAKEGA